MFNSTDRIGRASYRFTSGEVKLTAAPFVRTATYLPLSPLEPGISIYQPAEEPVGSAMMIRPRLAMKVSLTGMSIAIAFAKTDS